MVKRPRTRSTLRRPTSGYPSARQNEKRSARSKKLPGFGAQRIASDPEAWPPKWQQCLTRGRFRKLSDAGRTARAINARHADSKDWRSMRRQACDKELSQFADRQRRRELTVGLELADRAIVGVMNVLLARDDCRRVPARHTGFRRPVIILATHQPMETLPGQHHPRIEDEHAADDKGL